MIASSDNEITACDSFNHHISITFLQTMLEIKRKILKDETHAGKNSFLLTVICHGNDKGHLLDKDKKRAWILEDFIKELSLVETLIGKPKILVLQACRGGKNILRVVSIALFPLKLFYSDKHV